MKPHISLQLWSIREECEKDFLGTLSKVKALGYDGVEFAGYYDTPAEILKAHLDELGLGVSGSHLGLDRITDHLEETIAYEQAIGNQNLIVPYFDGETLAEWDEMFQHLKHALPAVAAAGLTLGYHNHAHEFTKFPGVNLLDELLKVEPQLKLEVDTYWVAYAGEETLAWLNAHREAIHLLHIKEMHQVGDTRESTEIGAGDLPIASYVQFAQDNRVPWLVVEQEAFQAHDPLTSAAINVQALQKIVAEVYA